MHVMVITYGEPKKGYLNFTLGNLWATQPIALLIWPTLTNAPAFTPPQKNGAIVRMDSVRTKAHLKTFET